MKRRKLYCVALVLLLLGGCAKDITEDLDDDKPINRDGSIAFRTDSLITRGTPSDDLTAYGKVNLLAYSHEGKYAGVKALYREAELTKTGGGGSSITWDYTPHMYWPEERGLSFLAYTSDKAYASASGSDGVFIKKNTASIAPTIEYTVPSDVKLQPDLLVTAQLDVVKAKNVTLTMKHALACVSFCATGWPQMRVKKITMKKVYRKATLELDNVSRTWVTDPSSQSLTVLEPGIDPDKPLEGDPQQKNYLMTEDGYLMMIPQKLTDATIDVEYWRGTAGSEKTITYTLPTNVVWEPGKKYVYKFGEATDEIVVYYEKYADATYGFQSSKTLAGLPAISEEDASVNKQIIEAGYGVLSKSRVVSSTTPDIKLGSNSAVKAKTMAVIKLTDGDYTLYAVNQTAAAGQTFALSATSLAPQEVFFDGNSVKCGKLIPHVAKGVSDYNLTAHPIRTPQQLRNISVLTTTAANNASSQIFKQERSLDFSKTTIGGATSLSTSVIDDRFYGTYNSDLSKSITNLKINAAIDYVGLFSYNYGTINNVVIKSSSIVGANFVGGITGENRGTITKPRIVGVANTAAGKVIIKGISSVGGIAGVNFNAITGHLEPEAATGTTVPAVTGWVDIEATGSNGNGSCVGGIVGDNQYGDIKTILVYGVNITGGTATEAKINIKGASSCVGGIAGINLFNITGTVTGTGTNIKNMPDVAGVVEITGLNYIGGIAGLNGASGNLNSVNVRLGRATSMKITGSGDYVGGVVGENRGGLGVQSTNTFISTRGNIEITGNNYVGGIIGNNAQNAKLENCFVYDFNSQGTDYAPKITCRGSGAGGIAGNNNGEAITNCGVFSSSAAPVIITAEGSNVGGIVGQSNIGITSGCAVVGTVEVNAKASNCGGIFGSNSVGSAAENCWIGKTDGNGVIENAVDNLGLVITGTSYGTPFVIGSSYVGGIVGLNSGKIDKINLADNVNIGKSDGTSNWVGGIVGANMAGNGTTSGVVQNCTVTNSSGKTITIRGDQHIGGIVGVNSGTVKVCAVKGTGAAAPFKIAGNMNTGGIVGFNNGIVENITLSSSITIGRADVNAGDGSNSVGGIVGGNAAGNGSTTGVIRNCSVNSATNNIITIQGAQDLGGIVGLSNGFISGCVVSGVSGAPVNIIGLGRIGGIAGQNGGNKIPADATGNDNTVIKGCKVSGYVTVKGNQGTLELATSIGGIVGMNGPTKSAINNIEDCAVSGTAAGSVNISVGGEPGGTGTVGGIVGTNSGNLLRCDVKNATMTSLGYFAGGIAGQTSANATSYAAPASYRSDLKDCRVYTGVSVNGVYADKSGALVGYLDSKVAIQLGSGATNLVNNTGVTVKGITPTGLAHIVGFSTGSAEMHYNIQEVLAR